MDKRSEILSLLALALSFSLFLFAYFPSSNPGMVIEDRYLGLLSLSACYRTY